jgi:hypothetical protein
LIAAVLCVALLAAPAHAAEHAPDTDPTNALPYVRFAPIFVPVIKGDQVSRQIGITLTMQLVDNSKRSDVEVRRKPLHDAFFRELYGFFQERVPASGHIDQALLKARLLKTATAIVGPNRIQEVLIVQLFERPK